MLLKNFRQDNVRTVKKFLDLRSPFTRTMLQNLELNKSPFAVLS